MKKLLTLTAIVLMAITLFSCYDDTGEDCEVAPSGCDQSPKSNGYLHFNVTSDTDVTLQSVRLCEGDDYDTGADCIIYTAPVPASCYVPNGEYSAMATYHVSYNGKTYTIEAVDGVDLSDASNDYCGGITCYTEGSETLELEFDRDAFIDMLNGTSKECFIATAAYGSGEAWQVEYLRSFRDRILSKSAAGRFFIRQYYAHSPAAADFISGRPALRFTVSSMLSAAIYAMIHPYIFSASFFVLIAAVILLVYVFKVRRRKPDLPEVC